MNEEELKIGMYTEDEIFQYMTEQEGGMLGRSMYDAILDKIHAQITEIVQLKNENQQLKEKLEKERKVRKEAVKFMKDCEFDKTDKYIAIGEYQEYKDLLNILDIDKG